MLQSGVGVRNPMHAQPYYYMHLYLSLLCGKLRQIEDFIELSKSKMALVPPAKNCQVKKHNYTLINQ